MLRQRRLSRREQLLADFETLPATWVSGSYRSNDGPLSAYGDNGGPLPTPPILGDAVVEPGADSVTAGKAEAFQLTANQSGSVGSVDSTSTQGRHELA